MNKYIFDVDGTLTPSRQVMDSAFAHWFEHFATHSAVYLVTGSDRQKTLEQVGSAVYNLSMTVYNCSGNDVWKQGTHIRTNEFKISDELRADLEKLLRESKFHAKTGRHIEERPGLCNFSIVGRNCSLEQRFLYTQWDEHKKERVHIADYLMSKYSDFRFQIAGETGIDITPVGGDKSQILKDFDLNNDHIYFFGDKMEYGGNDYELAAELFKAGHKIHQVKDWRNTWKILKG
jgi:phosphomannomutase